MSIQSASQRGGPTVTDANSPVPPVQAVQACVPRHRSPSREVVRLQAGSLCDPLDHRAGTEALRNNLHLDLVRPVPVNLRRDIYLLISFPLSVKRTP